MKALVLSCSLVAATTPWGAASATPLSGATLPVAIADRPITLPRGDLTFEAAVSVVRTPFVVPVVPFGAAGLGVRFGVTDDVTLAATPLTVDGEFGAEYAWFSAGGRARLLHGEAAELGVGLEFVFDPESGVARIQPSAAVALHLGHVARIDTGAQLSLSAGAGASPTSLSAIDALGDRLLPGIPLDATFQFAPFLFAGIHTGFGIADLSRPRETEFAKLGFSAGGTIPIHDAPVLDVMGGFEFPELLTSDPLVGGVLPDLWEATLTLRAHVHI